MSIFNKLVDFVTGGSAEVEIDLKEATLNKPFSVKVTAKGLHNNVDIDRVYLLIRCREGKIIEFKATDNQPLTDNEKILNEMKEWDVDTVAEMDHTVSGKEELKKGKNYEWSSIVDLSKYDKVSVSGEKHFVKWEVQAGLDVPGNDPDSGWQEFKMV